MTGDPRTDYDKVPWEYAACAPFPGDWWHLLNKNLGQIAEAKSICAECPIRDSCEEYALKWEGGLSIWAGLGLRERERKRGQRYLDARSRAEQVGARGD